MNPQTQNDFITPITPTPEPQAQPPKSKKKLWLIIAAVIVIAIIAAGAIFFLTKKAPEEKVNQQPSGNEPTSITFGTEKETISYAGNKMYDACNLMPISLLKTHVGSFEDSLKNLGTDTRLKDPLMMEHGYVDRPIDTIQGKDNVARDPGTLVSETAVDSTIRAGSFMSIGDSHCQYAQGENFNSNLVSVYVIQPPQPLHPKLVQYLDTMKANGRMAIESQGVQVYIEEPKEGDQANVAVYRKGNVVVFLKSLNFPLIQAASEEIVKNLQAPAGPLTVTYTGAYAQLKDTCKLFTASDFQQILKKPASAITTETLGLTELDPKTAVRECTRIEVERLKEGEISSTNVRLAVSRTEDAATSNLADLKTANSETTATPLKDLGDEAYTITEGFTKRRSIVVRVKNVTLTITSGGETKDADEAAFMSRTLPIAQIAVKNYNTK